jgi:hypothetical protein
MSKICTVLLLFILFFFPRQDNVEGKCGSWYNETYLGKTSLLTIPRKTFIDKKLFKIISEFVASLSF